MNEQKLIRDFSAFLADYPYPDEAREEFASALTLILKNPEAKALLEKHLNPYLNGFSLDYPSLMQDSGKTAELLGISRYVTDLVFCLVLAQYAEPLYLQKGYTHETYVNSMHDFVFKNRECKEIMGCYGSFVAFWFDRWLLATRVALGRLQFEPYRATNDLTTPDFSVKVGDPVINVHIPSDFRSAFDKENCDAAYAEARKVFADYCNGKPIFRCESWLLFPAHETILPETSNIRRFGSEYTKVGEIVYRDGDLWRLFGTKPSNQMDRYDDLPEDNSMRKIYKAYLLAGNKVGEICGYKL